MQKFHVILHHTCKWQMGSAASLRSAFTAMINKQVNQYSYQLLSFTLTLIHKNPYSCNFTRDVLCMSLQEEVTVGPIYIFKFKNLCPVTNVTYIYISIYYSIRSCSIRNIYQFRNIWTYLVIFNCVGKKIFKVVYSTFQYVFIQKLSS